MNRTAPGEALVAALFVDIDGTVVEHSTANWLPGVREKLAELAAQGHQIIFITARGDDGHPVMGVAATVALIENCGFPAKLIMGVQLPRMVICDMGPSALPVSRDDPAWIKHFA
jgi:hypothetical protein